MARAACGDAAYGGAAGCDGAGRGGRLRTIWRWLFAPSLAKRGPALDGDAAGGRSDHALQLTPPLDVRPAPACRYRRWPDASADLLTASDTASCTPGFAAVGDSAFSATSVPA